MFYLPTPRRKSVLVWSGLAQSFLSKIFDTGNIITNDKDRENKIRFRRVGREMATYAGSPGYVKNRERQRQPFTINGNSPVFTNNISKIMQMTAVNPNTSRDTTGVLSAQLHDTPIQMHCTHNLYIQTKLNTIVWVFSCSP